MRRVLTLTLFSVLLMCWTGRSWAVDLDEPAMKAVYLFNFAQYTSWPTKVFASADSPLSFCVFASENVAQELKKAEGRRISNHPARVIVVQKIEELKSCNLIYIDGASLPEMFLQEASRANTLIVSDNIDSGAIVFVKEGPKLGFSVNLNRASAAEIKLSSHLIKLAKTVSGQVSGEPP